MKTIFALIFCMSVILLMYLSGALGKDKPELIALQNFSLYDKIECTQDCADKKIIGDVYEGDRLIVLSQLKGKTKTVLRLETSKVAGWVAYDAELMQKETKESEESKY